MGSACLPSYKCMCLLLLCITIRVNGRRKEVHKIRQVTQYGEERAIGRAVLNRGVEKSQNKIYHRLDRLQFTRTSYCCTRKFAKSGNSVSSAARESERV